jgi:hypothetical protein
VVRRHRRFALDDVTLGGEPVGGATVDAWEDDEGNERWAARLLMPAARAAADGPLAGTTRDGRVRGDVQVGDNRPGPRSGRVLLVELHGQGPLLDEGGNKLGG